MYTLTINGNTPEELMSNLQTLANEGTAPQKTFKPEPVKVQTAAPVAQPPAIPQVTVTAENPTVAAVVPVAPTPPVQSAPPVSVTPPVTNPVPVAAAPTYTLDALAKAGASLAQSGKMEQALALLAKYGVPSVNQLPQEQYGAFATELRGLGAQI